MAKQWKKSFLTGVYDMETFSMVVLGGEYVTTYCWRPGVPTPFYLFLPAW